MRQGALVLRNTLPYMPVGVHVAVVDPQVGTERRALALRTADGRILVGPDNGLLSLAWPRCGGIDLAVDVTRSQHRLEPVSATFHGRDIFAPVAAQLARGAELADAGDQLDEAELQTVELPEPRVEDGTLVGHALVVDRFGNAALNVDHDDMAGTEITLGGTVEIEVAGERYLATYAQTFADVRPGELIVYEDAYRTLAVAINRGDAAATLVPAAGRRSAPAAAMIGSPRVHFRVTDSTNERARALAAAGAPHGTLVTADEQRAGRGRQGRAWTAPPRSAVLMSVVLRELSETLPLAAAVAVCEALPVEARIKWPNDVWIDGRKVAGILVEGRPQEGWAVLGIGLNVATEEFPAELSATSLRLAGAPLSPEDALAAVVSALGDWLPRPADRGPGRLALPRCAARRDGALGERQQRGDRGRSR